MSFYLLLALASDSHSLIHIFQKYKKYPYFLFSLQQVYYTYLAIHAPMHLLCSFAFVGLSAVAHQQMLSPPAKLFSIAWNKTEQGHI